MNKKKKKVRKSKQKAVGMELKNSIRNTPTPTHIVNHVRGV